MGCCHRLIPSDQGGHLVRPVLAGHYPEGFQQRACCAWKLSLWKISATLPIYLPLPINQPPTKDWMDHYMMISIRSIVWWGRSQVFQLTHKSIEELYNLSIQSTRFQSTRGRCKSRTIFSARCHKMSCRTGRTSFRRIFMSKTDDVMGFTPLKVNCWKPAKMEVDGRWFSFSIFGDLQVPCDFFRSVSSKGVVNSISISLNDMVLNSSNFLNGWWLEVGCFGFYFGINESWTMVDLVCNDSKTKTQVATLDVGGEGWRGVESTYR